MTVSPIGSVPFTALGREWTLRFGARQKFAVEQMFGCGFYGALLQVFPGVPREAIMGGQAASLAIELTPESIGMGALGMMLSAGILEQPGDDEVEAILAELGIQRQMELLMAAMAAGQPAATPGADAGNGEGASPPSQIPTKERTGKRK
jgi:hypothetical protein